MGALIRRPVREASPRSRRRVGARPVRARSLHRQHSDGRHEARMDERGLRLPSPEDSLAEQANAGSDPEGDTVTVELPDGSDAAGTVSEISSVAQTLQGASEPTVEVTIELEDIAAVGDLVAADAGRVPGPLWQLQPPP